MPEQKRTVRGVVGGLLGFVSLSVAAGVLVTATVTPALAVTGMAANNAIGVFDGLPEYLQINELMEKTNVYAVNAGKPSLMASFFDQNREEVQWNQMSQFLKDGAIAMEDNRFYDHGGVDVIGTTRAIVSNAISPGKNVQGGSSITQQYVKNVLVQECERLIEDQKAFKACYNEATGQKADRKLKEMRYAIGIEKKYSKNDILRGYLNISGFGGITYGVQSAAQYYFKTSAATVTLEQAATLIAILNNPEKYRLDRPEREVNGAADGYKLTLERRNSVLYKMFNYGKITKAQYDAAKVTKIVPTLTQPATGCGVSQTFSFFCDYVARVVLNDKSFGATYDDRRAALRRGGMDIYTTIDVTLQNEAYKQMHDRVSAAPEAGNLGAAAITVQPGTGRILSMTQSKYYSTAKNPGASFTSVNYNTDFRYGGSGGFQAGSTWKMFTLVEWLMKGHSVNETVNGVKRTFHLKDSCTPNMGSGPWSTLKNSGDGGGGKGGNLSVMQGTAKSTNTVFAAMAEQLDLCDISKTAQTLGAHRADGKALQTNFSSILGTNEVAPLTIAAAYAALANKGIYCAPIAIDKIVMPDGTAKAPPKASCHQAIPENVAATAIYALKGVMTGGTGTEGNPFTAPIFGKTGTTDNYKDTWLAGSTTKATTVVWVGNVIGKKAMNHLTVNGTLGSRVKFGLFRAIEGKANAMYGGDDFPRADSNLIRRVMKDVPNVAGKSVAEATTLLEDAGFNVAVSDKQVASGVGAGLVASTDPAGGTQTTSGATVTIFVSNGQGVAVPNVVGLPIGDATKALKDAGFQNVAENPTCTPLTGANNGDQVESQNPAAGAAVDKNTTVTLTLYCK